MKTDLETQIDVLAKERQLTSIALQIETYQHKIDRLAVEYDQLAGELYGLRSTTPETI
jgi:hypothetical protein